MVFQLDDEDDEKDKGEPADGVAKSKKKKKKKKKSAEEGAGQVAATDRIDATFTLLCLLKREHLPHSSFLLFKMPK